MGSEVFIIPDKYQDKWLDFFSFTHEVLLRAGNEYARMAGVQSSREMSKSDFESLEKRVDEFIKRLDYGLSDVNKVVADGAGSFSIALAPGEYLLIARSAHRSSYSNEVEVLGQIAVGYEKVEAGQTATAKLHFQVR